MDGAPIDKTLCEPLELFERDARGGGKRLQSDIISDECSTSLGERMYHGEVMPVPTAAIRIMSSA